MTVANNYPVSRVEPHANGKVILHVSDGLDLNTLLSNEITGETLLLNPVDKIPTFLDPILPRVGNVALAGGSDTGKSTLLRQLAIEFVAGEETFLGFKFTVENRCAIFVSTEDDQQSTGFVVSRQAKEYRPEALANLRFIFEITNLYEQLDEKLTRKHAALVIIDCFQDTYGNDSKDTNKIRQFLHSFQELAIKHQCLFIWLHHTAKRTENYEPSKNNLLSGQGLEAKMRMVMELRADLMDSSIRHLCIVKGNYISSAYKKESFVLRFAESDFHFTNTGERTPFEFLVKQNEDGGREKYELAKDLKARGYNYDAIAKEIGYDSKGSVSKLFAKAEKHGWDRGFQSVSNGNKLETGL